MSEATDSDERAADDAVQTPTRYGVPVVDGVDMPTLHVPREEWVTVAADLLVDGYTMCTDVTAVDYLTYAGHRRPVGDVVLEPAADHAGAAADASSCVDRHSVAAHAPTSAALAGSFGGSVTATSGTSEARRNVTKFTFIPVPPMIGSTL
mgnify:CR=1 FL=1